MLNKIAFLLCCLVSAFAQAQTGLLGKPIADIQKACAYLTQQDYEQKMNTANPTVTNLIYIKTSTDRHQFGFTADSLCHIYTTVILVDKNTRTALTQRLENEGWVDVHTTENNFNFTRTYNGHKEYIILLPYKENYLFQQVDDVGLKIVRGK